MNTVFGDTSNLKPSHVRALARLSRRSIPADTIVTLGLARDLLDLSHELNRQLGLFIDRRGRVSRVILGDAHGMQLPEFERVRGAEGRLRGFRLVLTHLVADGLNREELADLGKLRLDLIAAIHRGPAGIQVDLGSLAPAVADGPASFTTRTWPRVPLGILAREGGDEEPGEVGVDLPVPLPAFLRDLEARLVAATQKSQAAISGTRAMVLMVHDGGPSVEARKQEMRELCRTAGVALLEIAEQRRPTPDPRTFLGKGKLKEVLIRAIEQDVEVLVCDPELSASQARTIADATDLKVIDRTMLILDIFAQHAKSADGKLQVELAQLRYRLPHMVGRGTMMSRLMGGIGGRGPGETKLEIDRRRSRQRVADLERRLRTLRRRRTQQSALRRRSDVPIVAIVGYTNAGKSTLLNALTNSDVVAENKLFATLDPTVRRLRFPHDREIVLLDTVGFIRDLPPALRQAFSATLEAVADADLILHVIDANDPDTQQQRATVESILGELGAGRIAKLMVFNKADLLAPSEQELRRAELSQDEFLISALDRSSTRRLVGALEEFLWSHGRVDSRTPLPSSSEGSSADGSTCEPR